MKKQFLTIAVAIVLLVTGSVAHATGNNNKAVTTHAKILKDFNQEFLVAPSITTTDKGFLATSIIDGRKVDVVYNKNGNRKYSVVRYGFDNLDKNVIDIVKKEYDKYFITSMQKVEQKGFDAVYLVQLTDATSVKTIKITNEGSELLQSLERI